MSIVVLRKFEVYNESFLDVRSGGKTLFDRFCQTISVMPDVIRLVSSSEISFFLSPEMEAFIRHVQQKSKGARLKVVSQACLGFHAAIIDFYHSPERAAIIAFVEAPREIQQNFLDAAISRNMENPNRLKVSEGVGFAYLEKVEPASLKHYDIVIGHCDILYQMRNIMGPLALVRKITDLLKNESERMQVVSFELNSSWSDELIRYFDKYCTDALHPSNWLSSCEKGEHHYLTLKPLMELRLYENKSHISPLSVFTLGAGGRFGIITVGTPCSGVAESSISQCSLFSFSLRQDLERIREVESSFSNAGTARIEYLNNLANEIKYIQKQYAGIDNAVFEWLV
ncbi:MAG: hypothetical protein HQK54_10055 [Oligoflexales bacterium]|nr:hypothetical protein [Oligoflexales bacterium]